MVQHFLLSAAARTLSLKAIYAEGEDAAYNRFCRLRWPETAGAPVCPRCAWRDAYSLSTRRRFKCKACHHQFSVTSGTVFASRNDGAYVGGHVRPANARADRVDRRLREHRAQARRSVVAMRQRDGRAANRGGEYITYELG